MDKYTLTFKSSLLERMYEKTQEDNILVIFVLSLRIIMALCVPFLILEIFLSDDLMIEVTVGMFIVTCLMYFYVTRRKRQYAKYVLGIVSIGLCITQYTQPETWSAEQIYMSGSIIIFLQMGLISQNGLKLNTFYMLVLLVIKISISALKNGFMQSQLMLPFAMCFYNYFIYLKELSSRTLFLQTLKENQWGNKSQILIFTLEKILPIITDKNIIILRYNQEKMSFSFKYQNVIYDESEPEQQQKIRNILRGIFINKKLDLEKFLFQKYQHIMANASKKDLTQETLKVKLPNQFHKLSDQTITVITQNLKDLDFILVLNKIQDELIKPIQLKKIYRIFKRNNMIMLKAFQFINKIFHHTMRTNINYEHKYKLFEMRKQFLECLILNLNIREKTEINQQQQNLKAIDLPSLVRDVTGYYCTNTMKIRIFNQIPKTQSEIVTQVDRLQLLLLNILRFSIRKLVTQQIKIILQLAQQKSGGTVYPIFQLHFSMIAQDPEQFSVSKIIEQLLGVLGPTSIIAFIKGERKANFTITIYQDLSKVYSSIGN